MSDIDRAFGDEEEPAPHEPDCKCSDCRPDLLAAELEEERQLYQAYQRLQQMEGDYEKSDETATQWRIF